ncbi:MAG: DUF1573 domain-containing protein [Bacteroidales bacterium]
MNKFFLSLVAISLSLLSFAQESTDKDAAPKDAAEIYFEKSVHDYGVIPHKGNGIYEFEFENRGNLPLLITNASSSCGCTVPDYPKTPILPGEKGKISVSYDTKRLGAFHKSVTLRTNASNAPSVMLYIKGEVKHIQGEAKADVPK